MTSDRDPAVQMWQESTSARLRRVEAELGSALGALTQASAEVLRLRALLTEAYDANYRLMTGAGRPADPDPTKENR